MKQRPAGRRYSNRRYDPICCHGAASLVGNNSDRQPVQRSSCGCRRCQWSYRRPVTTQGTDQISLLADSADHSCADVGNRRQSNYYVCVPGIRLVLYAAVLCRPDDGAADENPGKARHVNRKIPVAGHDLRNRFSIRLAGGIIRLRSDQKGATTLSGPSDRR